MVKFAPMSSPAQLHVALRKSALSLCHAQYIRDRLLVHHPACEITVEVCFALSQVVRVRSTALVYMIGMPIQVVGF